jgi:hypothetical protein
LAAKGHIEEATAQLAELEKLPSVEGDAGLNRIKDVLTVAVLDAKARIALAENKAEEAVGLLQDRT